MKYEIPASKICLSLCCLKKTSSSCMRNPLVTTACAPPHKTQVGREAMRLLALILNRCRLSFVNSMEASTWYAVTAEGTNRSSPPASQEPAGWQDKRYSFAARCPSGNCGGRPRYAAKGFQGHGASSCRWTLESFLREET